MVVQDEKGAFRMALGAWLGLFAGVIAVALPLVAIFLSTYDSGGFFSFGTPFVQTSSALVLAGAILYILSLFLYRVAFVALRKVDSDFSLASFLCLLGSVGFLLIIISAAVLAGSSTSVLQCVHGEPSHALSCLQSGQPLGAYTGILGFVFAWMGGLGVVLGLSLAGRRFDEPMIDLGAFFYLIFLFLVLAPFVAMAVPLPGIVFLLLVVPILVVAAPLLILLGALPTVRVHARAI